MKLSLNIINTSNNKMENYLIAFAIATITPSLIVKGCETVLSGSWYLGKRIVYGKPKSDTELIQQKIEQMEKEFQEKMLEIQNREKNIDLKLDQIIQQQYHH